MSSRIKENITIATKGLVAAIPYIGGSLTSVWSDIEATQAKRKMERLEQFYIELKNDVADIQSNLQTEYINRPDFLDVFEQTAKYVVNERREEKRVMFKNIFVNSMVGVKCTYDHTEKYLRILEPMNSVELLVLKILLNPKKYNESIGEIITDPNWIRPGVRNGAQYRGVYNFLEMLCELVKRNDDDVYEAVMYLESNRLVVNDVCKDRLETNGHPIHALDNKLTDKGKNFISFISR